jgi:hypothetical protein
MTETESQRAEKELESILDSAANALQALVVARHSRRVGMYRTADEKLDAAEGHLRTALRGRL